MAMKALPLLSLKTGTAGHVGLTHQSTISSGAISEVPGLSDVLQVAMS